MSPVSDPGVMAEICPVCRMNGLVGDYYLLYGCITCPATAEDIEAELAKIAALPSRIEIPLPGDSPRKRMNPPKCEHVKEIRAAARRVRAYKKQSNSFNSKAAAEGAQLLTDETRYLHQLEKSHNIFCLRESFPLLKGA